MWSEGGLWNHQQSFQQKGIRAQITHTQQTSFGGNAINSEGYERSMYWSLQCHGSSDMRKISGCVFTAKSLRGA